MNKNSTTFIMDEMKTKDTDLDTKYWYDKHCNYHNNNEKPKKKCNKVYDKEQSYMKYRQVLRSLRHNNDDNKTYWRWPFSPVNSKLETKGGGYYRHYQKYKKKYLLHRQ